MSAKVRVMVPGKFWQDHVLRECEPRATALYRLGQRVMVEGTRDELENLLNDARYYGDPSMYGPGGFDSCYRGLLSSAIRTVHAVARALNDAPPPEEG